MRERWLGATGLRVPEIAVEGTLDLPDDALIVGDVSNVSLLMSAHASGTPVVVRASTARAVQTALARPEVSCVLVPANASELLELDLTGLTYG